MRERTDAELVVLARAGASAARAELFERYCTVAWHAAYAVTGDRALAEDAAQDAIERAFAALDTFDERRAFGPWIRRIAVNRAIDELRRRRRLTTRDAWPEEIGPPLAVDEADEAVGAVAAAVAALPPNKRIVIVLHYWFDFSATEIAETLGIPFGTVASRLSRGLTEVRARLEERDDERLRASRARGADDASTT